MKVRSICTFLAATLSVSVSLGALANQPPTLWKVHVTAKTPSGPQEFALTVPDGNCVIADLKDQGTLMNAWRADHPAGVVAADYQHFGVYDLPLEL